jgi:hypothetical protein
MRYSGFLDAVRRGLGREVLGRPNAPAKSGAAFDWLIAQGLTPAIHRRSPAIDTGDHRRLTPAIHRRYGSGIRFRAGWPGSANFARSDGRLVHLLAGPSHFRLKRGARGERSAG